MNIQWSPYISIFPSDVVSPTKSKKERIVEYLEKSEKDPKPNKSDRWTIDIEA